MLHISSCQTFEGHSEASDVLRELFKSIEVCGLCQAQNQFFSRNCFAWPFSRVTPKTSRATILQPIRAAQKLKYRDARQADAEHSAPRFGVPLFRRHRRFRKYPLNYTCSGLGLDTGRPLLLDLSRSNAWTALRRSLS